MKRIIYFLSFLFFISACNSNEKQNKKAEDDLDAARTFIEAALKGDFNKARDYVLKDSTNLQFLDAWERKYKNQSEKDKEGYYNATPRFFDVKKINDSATVVVYSNSYKNKKDTLKVLKENNQWLVDVKYLWLHDDDSIFKKTMVKKDSL